MLSRYHFCEPNVKLDQQQQQQQQLDASAVTDGGVTYQL